MENKPRIAIMLPRFSRYGGVEGYGFRLAEFLAQKGLEVDFICGRQESEPPPGVRVIPVGRFGGLQFIKKLWFMAMAERARRKGQYDLSLSLGNTWSQDISRIGGGPLPTFWRLSQEAWPAGPRRFLKQLSRKLSPSNWLTMLTERRLYRNTPYIVAISDLLRQWIEETYPHLKDRTNPAQELLTIYNYPDISRFCPPLDEEKTSARRKFNAADDTFAIGVATTNFALKGVGHLIRALALLPEDTHLHIAGGRHPAKYIRQAKGLGVAQRVHFHGKVTDMPAFYHSLDMFILPSFYDTLANVVLEAMGSGLKTICSSRAGAASFVPPDQVLDDPADAREIAEKITALRAKDHIQPCTPKGSGLEDFHTLIIRALNKKRGE